MSTSNKDFKIKNGLIVQGTTATVNGNDILTSASNLDDLANVNTTGVADGNALVYDVDTSQWIPGEAAGGASVELGDTPPANPDPGNLWIDSANGALYVYYQDVDSSQWIAVQTATAVTSATVSEDPPGNPADGDFWVDASTGILYIWYVDDDGSQWIAVKTSVAGASGGGGASIEVSDVAPESPSANDVWFDIDDGILYTYYVDEDSSQWVQISGAQGSQGESGIVAQATPPGDTSVLWVDTDAPGIGLPNGGITGQMLTKASSSDLDMQWSFTSLAKLSDANISSPQNKHLLRYDSATSKWINTFHDGQFPNTIISASNYIVAITTETTDNIQLDFANETGLVTRNAASTVNFTGTNYTAGSTITVRIVPGGAARNLTFPAGWVFVGSKPTQAASGKTGILTVTSFGTTEADCVASWVSQL